jgi:VanZ family protein
MKNTPFQVVSSVSFRRFAAIVIYIVILAGSSVPGSSIPKIFKFTPDKLIHCLEYFTFGFLVIRWVVAEFKTSFRYQVLITLALGAFAAMFDELYQHLTPGRTPDVWDWCLDVVGIVLSILIFRLFQNKVG